MSIDNESGASRMRVFMQRCSFLFGFFGGEGADVVDQVPALIFVEGTGEARHGFSAFADLPEKLAVGFVADVGGTEVGGRVGQVGGFRAVAFAALAVTRGAFFCIDAFAGGDGLRGGG